MFPPEYEPLPDHVVFKYDGEEMRLSPPAEEIAGFYARLLEVSWFEGVDDWKFSFTYFFVELSISWKCTPLLSMIFFSSQHDYTTKDAFNKNFFRDWRKNMTEKEQKLIKDLRKCDFWPMHAYFVEVRND